MAKLAVLLALAATAAAFVHPGLLHTENDFSRIKTHVDNGDEPWLAGWNKLISNSHASPTYQPNPQATVYRGSDGVHSENYRILYNDIHAAYQLAVRWKIDGSTTYADASIKILNAWSSTMKAIGGNSDGFLAAGIYGYQLANAGEIMRTYSGWSEADRTALGTLLRDVFYRDSYRFLTTHNGQPRYHYWANWDFCSLANIMATGVFTDNQTMYDYAVNYFLHGDGMGALPNFIIANHTEAGSGKILAQGQEAGRDQGHATLDISLLSVILQQAFNQGDDFFTYMTNSGLAASEYAAKYNVNEDVPFSPYYNPKYGNTTVISASSRGTLRPGFELMYSQYDNVMGLNASWTKKYVDAVNANTDGVEGGGGNYGANSGGYDYLGFGTLLYRRKA
ncbi:hypothetical protein AK830_g2063 [Neonectria ditissima]|uniref:Alginate lyase domain-containing protein n=1 Tax=Neonectria ditissima TaxID=78410 RepID=A0A0P7BVP7_9HYPO|nr:hypothetical protein AK830_g2063 [Neonectria ditissima]